MPIREIYDKSTSLLKYFKDEIATRVEIHENATKLIRGLERVTGADAEKAFKVKSDIIEMMKVLEYEISSSQNLCSYFEVIVICIGRIIKLKEKFKFKSKRSGGAKRAGKNRSHKVPRKTNMTLIRRQIEFERRARSSPLLPRQPPRHQPPPGQVHVNAVGQMPFSFKRSGVKLGMYFTTLALLTLLQSAHASSPKPYTPGPGPGANGGDDDDDTIYAERRSGSPGITIVIPPATGTASAALTATTNALTSALSNAAGMASNAITAVAAEAQSGIIMDAFAIAVATAGFGLETVNDKTGTIPADSEKTFALAALGSSKSLANREDLLTKKNWLQERAITSVMDPANSKLLETLLSQRSNSTQISPVTVVTDAVRGLQLGLVLGDQSSNVFVFRPSGNRHTPVTETLLGPLKTSAGKLAGSQVELLKNVITTGDADVLKGLHDRLKVTYGARFNDARQLKNIETASDEVSMLHDNSGVGAIKFVSKNSVVLKGILSEQQINALTEFHSNISQQETAIATTRLDIANLDKEIAAYEASWFTAPFTKEDYELKRKHVAALKSELKELEKQQPSAQDLRSEFDTILKTTLTTNRDLLRSYLIDEQKQSSVNFNLLFMAICSSEMSPFGALVHSVGGSNTAIGSLLTNMFPTDSTVLVALTQNYSHISGNGELCTTRCKARAATAPFCQKHCLSEANQAVHDTIGRAYGLTPFIATIGEIAMTIKSYCSARRVVLTTSSEAAPSNKSFTPWKQLVESAVIEFPGNPGSAANVVDVERFTHLFTLDTILSRTMLASLAQNENANFNNLITYISSLISFPSQTPGCLIANEFLRTYGTNAKETSELTQKPGTWHWLFQSFSTVSANKVESNKLLTDLSTACLSFSADAERVEVFKKVVFDCAKSGTLSDCSSTLVGQLGTARGANALLDLTSKLSSNLQPQPEEVMWLWGHLAAIGGFVGSLGSLMGSLRMIILVAIIVVLMILKLKFGFIWTMISRAFALMRTVTTAPGRFAIKTGVAVKERFFRRNPPAAVPDAVPAADPSAVPAAVIPHPAAAAVSSIDYSVADDVNSPADEPPPVLRAAAHPPPPKLPHLPDVLHPAPAPAPAAVIPAAAPDLDFWDQANGPGGPVLPGPGGGSRKRGAKKMKTKTRPKLKQKQKTKRAIRKIKRS